MGFDINKKHQINMNLFPSCYGFDINKKKNTENNRTSSDLD